MTAWGVVCGCVFLAGCASATQAGFNPGLGGKDLVNITDDMAIKIVGDPEVQSAIQQKGQLRVVVMPVENYMRAEVLPRGPAQAFTGRIRTLLSRHAPERFTWIMNRDDYHALRGRELDIDLGPSPDAINPEYALTAKFTSLAHEHAKGRSNYYLTVFELTNLSDRTVLWADSYEVKRAAVKGAFD